MYKIYKIEKGIIENYSKISKNSSYIWIDLREPTEADLKELKPLITIPEEVITDSKDINEVPKLEQVEEWQYILLQTPIAQKNNVATHATYTVTPLSILINSHYIVTITNDRHNAVLHYLDEKIKNITHNKIIDTTKPTEFVIKIILFTSKIFLRHLKHLGEHLHLPTPATEDLKVEKRIIELLKIEESLVYFNTSLRSNHIVAEKIAKRKQFTLIEKDEELLDDALDENRQAIEMAGIYSKIVEDIRNALSSLISNKLTRTVNGLTKVTILLMIPAMIGSLYGMNIPLPLQEYVHAFWIIIIVSIICTALGMLWMNKKEKQ